MPVTSLTFGFGTSGIVVPSYSDVLAYLQYQWLQIYGIDVTQQPSSSPDNQALNIFTQVIYDNVQLIVSVNAGFSPDQATGTVLDWRVAYNGIQRQAGTFSITNLTIVTTRGLTLYGLDQTIQPAFTVADAAGNLWVLVNTQVIASAGTYTYPFQAAVPGSIQTTVNTITAPVTVAVGVASVNNPSAQSVLGLNEESDASLRIRRQGSVTIGSQGYLSSLLAALQNIAGVTYAYVYENSTGATDANGVPGHSIWVVVSGNYDNSLVAQAIYNERNAGAGMFGNTSYPVVQVDGTTFTVLWDTVLLTPLFVKFTATSLDQKNPPNIAAILNSTSGVPFSYQPGVAMTINANDFTTAVHTIDPNTFVSNVGFSTTAGGTYTATLAATNKRTQWDVVTANTIVLAPYLTAASSAGLLINTYTINGSGVVTNSPVSVAHGGNTLQFSALGGYGTAATPYTKANVSGTTGTILGSSGLYTAGATAGVDTVTWTDSLGNTAVSTVTVT